MPHYIALLRAVNVGGRTVKMERLRSLFVEMGFENVNSYIQSGNVFFESSELNRIALTQTIEDTLNTALGFAVPAIIRTIEECAAAISLDPFSGIEVSDDMRLCIAFVAGTLPNDIILPFWTKKNDAQIVAATKNELFAVTYLIDGRPGNFGAAIEKTFKVVVTVRYFETTKKILNAAIKNTRERA